MVIKQYENKSKWFAPGIPPANLVAFWQQPNEAKTSLYPDDSNTITYKLNSLGYRDVDWSDSELEHSIWCVGGSDVLGIGVEQEQTWPSRLSELSGMLTTNLGIAGGAWDTFARVVISGLQKYRPVMILIQATPEVRREFVNKEKQTLVLPMLQPYEDFYKHLDEESDQYNVEKNIQLIQVACQNLGVDCYIFDLDDRWKIIKQDPSIDNTHIGPNTHNQIAEELATCLNLKI